MLAALVALVLAAVGVSVPLGDDYPPAATVDTSRHAVVAVFGATGLVGEGVFEALVRDPDVRMVHVVTRRRTPAIDAAAADGRATVWVHTDYLDYAPLASMLADVDAVYWALGTSAFNVSDEEYSQIHVDFPVRFVAAWLAARGREAPRSFHLVSGSGASDGSWFHWAREKARAERTLVHEAAGTGLRIVSYRPAGVLREGGRARWYTAPFWLLRPLKRAVEPTAIGQAMLEVTARGSDVPGGILETRDLLRFANGYRVRRGR
ncbi:MAG: NAD(P)H-binding protein [Vicinamibacterales bacterium]